MKKISIIGSGGSGKSTLAKKLGTTLNIKVYHLDSLFWKPNWLETEHGEWRDLQESLCVKDAWIMDGNYGGTMDVRLKHSDTVIFLDINRIICLYRVMWRTIMSYRRTRPDMAEGCKERFDFGFLRYIWDYPSTRQAKIIALLESLPSPKRVIILRSSTEVEKFLKTVF